MDTTSTPNTRLPEGLRALLAGKDMPRRLVEQVRKIAEAEPDFVYLKQPNADGECSYVAASVGVATGRGCIVGQAMIDCGVDRSDLEELEASEGAVGISHLLKLAGHSPALPAPGWLDGVQYAQDCGQSWGSAVRGADEAAGLS